MKKLVFVVNVDWFFISHRLTLAKEAIKRGFDVYILTKNSGRIEEIESLGAKFIEIPFERSGTNPFHELKCVIALMKAYNKIKPDVIHNITLKSAILGSIAAKLTNNYCVVNAISGFGYNFTDGRDGVLQKVVKFVLKLAFKSKAFSFILQNPDDIRSIANLNLTNDSNIHLIKGSGVDLKQFAYSETQTKDVIVILFPARMLRDKGVYELIDAAKSLKNKLKDKVKFVLAGDCDKDNLAGISESDLINMLDEDYIEWIGFQKDMYPIYKSSDIVVLPSYREGLPKSLIEACAVGRAIITTDVPGCRECVVDGYNGLLVAAKSSNELSDAIMQLTDDPKMRDTFGRNSRELAEREFSIESVVEKHFNIYGDIISR